MRFLKIQSMIAVVFLFALAPTHSKAASGDVDPGFNASVFGTVAGVVNVIRKQPDGKYLIGGSIQDINGRGSSAIGRLNADGTVDTSFSPPDFFDNTNGSGFLVNAIALQVDGKILVGGSYTGVDGVFMPGVRRLNPDGSIDSTFTVRQINSTDVIYDIEVTQEGKILVGGTFQTAQNPACANFCRLNPDGSVDTTLAGGSSFTINEIELQSDGKVLVGNDSLFRRNADGSIDNTFTLVHTNGVIKSIAQLPNGQLLIAGTFSTVNSFATKGIARLFSDQTIDLTFNENHTGPNGDINDMYVQSDGKIMIGGSFTFYNVGGSGGKILRLNSDGTPDSSYQVAFSLSSIDINDIEPTPDNKVYGGGKPLNISIQPLVRLNTNGTLDNTLSINIASGGRVRKVLYQPDGKVLIGGTFKNVGGVKRLGLARLNADGSLDTGFVPYFNDSVVAQSILAIALLPGGKIQIASDAGVGLKRLNADGSLDGSFNANQSATASVYDIVPLPSGELIGVGNIGTSAGTKRILKYSATGVIDTTFAVGQPNFGVYRVLLQPDGKILIGGDFTQIDGIGRGHVARLNTDGTLDPTFSPPGGANSSVYNMALQPDGKVLLAGGFSGVNGSTTQQYVGRLNADGSLDTSFIQSADAPIVGLTLQPDGKILIGGRFAVVGGISRRGIARLNSNGTFDSGFTATANADVLDFAVQPDGNILAAGEFTRIKSTYRVRVARLLNPAIAPRASFDFDGDTRADISITRPGAGYTWYQLLGTSHTFKQFDFGQTGDIVAPADFDGDGKTDPAIFRPSSGQWWYLSSVDGQQKSVTSGAAGDIPLPSDFTGDGKADFVLYRPSTQQWWRLENGTATTSNIAFGAPGDKPLIGDFDGDGKSDPAIYRPSTGQWWYAASSAGNAFRAFQWGNATDIPAAADYDGDGKTDFAIFRPSSGDWWIFNSSTSNYTVLTWGANGDKPIPADYDGDGKADIAVFRPSNGTWYLLTSSSGFSGFQWGISTDIPSPGAFVP